MVSPSNLRAAQYVRMSTDGQDCSIAYQTAHNAAFAAYQGLEIVRTYRDEGISGLSLRERFGLQQLLADVSDGHADYDTIVVFDISRWGRFQNPDESAYYEFLCARAGVHVMYSADPALNDGSLTATLVKSIKRVMAAEYSRDVSGRQSASKRSLFARGIWCGGPAPYGYRRQLVGSDGRQGPVLAYGERIHIPGLHPVLIPGPPEEVATVRRIFQDYGRGSGVTKIAKRLNAEGISYRRGCPWSYQNVTYLLKNEIYAGVLVLGRATTFLGETRKNPPDQHARIANFVDPLVSKRSFAVAQRTRTIRRNRTWSEAELLRGLTDTLAEVGALSGKIVNRSRLCANRSSYERAFGTLGAAFALIGYEQPTEWQRRGRRLAACREARLAKHPAISERELIDDAKRVFDRVGYLSLEVIRGSPDLCCPEVYFSRFGSIRRVYELVGYVPSARQAAAIAWRERGAAQETPANSRSRRRSPDNPRRHSRID